MCDSRQPIDGADSAQALANAIAVVEAGGLTVGAIVPRCVACSEPALFRDIYCKQHRLRAEEEDRL